MPSRSAKTGRAPAKATRLASKLRLVIDKLRQGTTSPKEKLVYVVHASGTLCGQQCELNVYDEGNDVFRCKHLPSTNSVYVAHVVFDKPSPDDMTDVLTAGKASKFKLIGTATAVRHYIEDPANNVPESMKLGIDNMMTFNVDSAPYQ